MIKGYAKFVKWLKFLIKRNEENNGIHTEEWMIKKLGPDSVAKGGYCSIVKIEDCEDNKA